MAIQAGGDLRCSPAEKFSRQRRDRLDFDHATTHSVDLKGLADQRGAVTFRLTATGATAEQRQWRVDNVLVRGKVEQEISKGTKTNIKTLQTVVAGASVFFDLNGNQSLDPGEPTATSDSNGATTLDIPDTAWDAVHGEGFLYAIRGNDVIKGVPHELRLRIPLVRGQEEVVLSPLGLVLASVRDLGFDAETANAFVGKAFGLPGQVDIATFAYSGEVNQSNPQAAAVLQASTQAGAFATAVGAALRAADGEAKGAWHYQQGVIDALAAAVVRGDRLEFLTSVPEIRAVVEQSASNLGVKLPAGIAQTSAEVLRRGFNMANRVKPEAERRFR